MQLDHEKLDVYGAGLEFLVFSESLLEKMQGRTHLRDQLGRAALSIVLNLAEGVGRQTKPDKRRFYVTARGSAMESAALVDVCLRLRVLTEPDHAHGKQLLVRIVAMLTKLVRAVESR